MNRRCFIKNASSFAIASVFLNGCTTDFLTEVSLDKNNCLEHIEIHLAQHCNLKCKFCSHFSSIAQEEFYNVLKYQKDLERLSQLTSAKIKNIQLLGGEPLLHPEINKILEITRNFFPDTEIQVVTNGILLETINESFYKILNKNKIALFVSVYPIDLNWESILRRTKKYKVDIFNSCRKKLTLKNLEESTIKSFYKLNLDLLGKQPIDKKCHFHKQCAYFDDGKIYPCFVVGNIRHFNKKFNKKIPVTQKDFIDIYKTKNIKEILAFFEKLVPFCRYCNTTNISNEKWAHNPKPNISQWT